MENCIGKLFGLIPTRWLAECFLYMQAQSKSLILVTTCYDLSVKQLQLEQYFASPIWFADEPKFVDDLNKASDSYINQAKKNLKKDIDKRNKKFGDKGDMGHVFHSTSLIGDPNFKELQDYVGATSHNLLLEMGYDLKDLSLIHI